MNKVIERSRSQIQRLLKDFKLSLIEGESDVNALNTLCEHAYGPLYTDDYKVGRWYDMWRNNINSNMELTVMLLARAMDENPADAEKVIKGLADLAKWRSAPTANTQSENPNETKEDALRNSLAIVHDFINTHREDVTPPWQEAIDRHLEGVEQRVREFSRISQEAERLSDVIGIDGRKRRG